MHFDVVEVDSVKRKLTVTVEVEELKTVEEAVLKDFRKHASIPGFRPGKAPVAIVRKRYAEQIRGEVLEKALSRYYFEALRESEINPISQGEIQDVNFENVDSPMVFELEVEVEPKIEIKKFKGLKVEREIPVVTDAMIDEALDNLRKEYATTSNADIVEKDYFVTLDAQLLGEGDMPVIGQKMEDHVVQIGSGTFDAEIEEQLIGLKPGEESVVRKAHLPPLGDTTQSPSMETYRVTIKSIEMQELPALDDELALTVGMDDVETLDQLKARVNENIAQQLEQRGRQQFQNRMIDELLKENPFEVPEAMVENYLNHFMQNIGGGNQPPPDFDLNGFRQQFRPNAIHEIRWYLLKQQLIEDQSIEVVDEDVTAKIDSLSFPEAEKEKALADDSFKQRVRDDLIFEKVMNLLESNAKITDIYPEGAEESAAKPKKAGAKKKKPAAKKTKADSQKKPSKAQKAKSEDPVSETES